MKIVLSLCVCDFRVVLFVKEVNVIFDVDVRGVLKEAGRGHMMTPGKNATSISWKVTNLTLIFGMLMLGKNWRYIQ